MTLQAEAPRAEEPTPVKPRMRGMLHLVAAAVAVPAMAVLVVRAHHLGPRLVTALYGVSVVALFGVSALFHRVTWGPVGRRRMRRLDHTTIFFAIAGSYTAVAGLGLAGWPRVAVLATVWGGSAIGVAVRQAWLDAPKWAIAIPYVAVGWAALEVLPYLLHSLGGTGFALLLAGGVAYSLGAVAYSAKRPNPVPGVFGYHEVFHTATLVGAICHYAVVCWFVLPAAGR